ncbi:MAG TPA: helix-turn-helix transcriptional regulator [Oligoflexia bacterium]|nr:helix-turn-helix transcriptional regulator [Oligoflexia bacterium]HMP49736.1 helix-turn-helix transcriptional regulator [Oligoflexia bacterium]
MNNLYFPHGKILKDMNLSERKFANVSGVSRGTLRKIYGANPGLNLSVLSKIAEGADCSLDIIIAPRSSSEFSTVAISSNVIRDGFESWKIHFINFVDEFRSCPDPRLIILEPLKELDKKLFALLSSITHFLCNEIALAVPVWAKKSYFLDEPWFVAGTEALKAFALLESPLEFRSNNIFVLENFLYRA